MDTMVYTRRAIVEFYEERAGVLEFLSLSIRPFAEDQALRMTAIEFSLSELEVKRILDGDDSDAVHDDQ